MTAQLQVTVDHNEVRVGERFRVSFQRTLRVPEDGQIYPLPPGFGPLPVHRVDDYPDRVPPAWREQGGVIVPMYQREALWLGFGGAAWKPNAVKVGVGRINVVSGEAWEMKLRNEPQNYIVCPDQPWLDGINVGDAMIRQFVAAPLGSGLTVEAQLTGADRYGGIQILVFEPKLGRFPDRPSPSREGPLGAQVAHSEATISEMGIGAGGKIRQKVYPDPYGLDSWDQQNYGCVYVHIVNSEQYQDLTGREVPPTPISVRIYNAYGFPWFDLYDEDRDDVEASKRLGKVEAMERKMGGREAPEDVDPIHVEKLRARRPNNDQ